MAAWMPLLEGRELERVQLAVLEQRLADVRRTLVNAAALRPPRPIRADLIALAGLAADLHRAVLEEMAR